MAPKHEGRTTMPLPKLSFWNAFLSLPILSPFQKSNIGQSCQKYLGFRLIWSWCWITARSGTFPCCQISHDSTFSHGPHSLRSSSFTGARVIVQWGRALASHTADPGSIPVISFDIPPPSTTGVFPECKTSSNLSWCTPKSLNRKFFKHTLNPSLQASGPPLLSGQSQIYSRWDLQTSRNCLPLPHSVPSTVKSVSFNSQVSDLSQNPGNERNTS